MAFPQAEENLAPGCLVDLLGDAARAQLRSERDELLGWFGSGDKRRAQLPVRFVVEVLRCQLGEQGDEVAMREAPGERFTLEPVSCGEHARRDRRRLDRGDRT